MYKIAQNEQPSVQKFTANFLLKQIQSNQPK